MRIFFISPNPIWGGAASANLEIATMLAFKHEVIYNDEYSHIHSKNVEIDCYPIHQTKNSNELFNYVCSKDIDMVIWGIAMTLPYYRKATKMFHRAGIKQLLIFHSLALCNNFKDKIMEIFVSISVKYIDSLIFVSKFTEISWSKYGTIKRHPNHNVIFNPINFCEVKKHTTGRKGKCIGFVGRFSEEKQPELFCELANQSSTYNFVAYGDGPLLNNMKSKYSKVDFKGYSNDIQSIYSDIDILVMTSKFENCPMVIIEAKKYGIPCVAPNVGGIPEIVQDGVDGKLYDKYEIQKILTCIEVIDENYERYSNSCQNTIKAFFNDSIMTQWSPLL